MKIRFYKVLSLGLLSLGTTVFADTVAIVDLYKIVRNLPDLERVQEEMQKETSVAQGKLNNKKVQLDAKVQEFESNKDTLSEQKMDKIRKEITTLQRDLKYLEADLREDLAMREQDQKNILVKQAVVAVNQFAVANKIDCVFSAENVVYASENKDITDSVIKSFAPAVAPVVAAPAPAPAPVEPVSKKSGKK